MTETEARSVWPLLGMAFAATGVVFTVIGAVIGFIGGAMTAESTLTGLRSENAEFRQKIDSLTVKMAGFESDIKYIKQKFETSEMKAGTGR